MAVNGSSEAGVPDRDNYSGLTKSCEQHPTLSIVVLSGEREAVLHTFQVMFRGSKNFHAAIGLPDHASAAQPNKERSPINGAQSSSTSDLGLTVRQLDVLALMMQAKSNKVICRVLNLAEPTVKNHVTAILKALKVSSRTEAVIAVGELGWKLPSPAQRDMQSRISRSNSNVAAPAVS
jgi:DNA-binding NarL/FixJ family response regulator